MRLRGFAAAAAVSLAYAGQADATTWLRYQVAGSGVETLITSFSTVSTITRQQDFILSFSVEVDPTNGTVRDSVGGASYSSDGAKFTTIDFASVAGPFIVDGQIANLLTISAPGTGYPYVGIQASLSYVDGDNMVGLPRLLASSVASGTLAYRSASKGQSRTFDGQITQFSIVGTTTGFDSPFLETVPEPASWVLMIAGIGVVGASVRKRRRAAYA